MGDPTLHAVVKDLELQAIHAERAAEGGGELQKAAIVLDFLEIVDEGVEEAGEIDLDAAQRGIAPAQYFERNANRRLRAREGDGDPAPAVDEHERGIVEGALAADIAAHQDFRLDRPALQGRGEGEGELFARQKA